MDGTNILNAAMSITAWIEDVIINGLLGRGFGFLTGGFGSVLAEIIKLLAAMGSVG